MTETQQRNLRVKIIRALRGKNLSTVDLALQIGRGQDNVRKGLRQLQRDGFVDLNLFTKQWYRTTPNRRDLQQ